MFMPGSLWACSLACTISDRWFLIGSLSAKDLIMRTLHKSLYLKMDFGREVNTSRATLPGVEGIRDNSYLNIMGSSSTGAHSTGKSHTAKIFSLSLNMLANRASPMSVLRSWPYSRILVLSFSRHFLSFEQRSFPMSRSLSWWSITSFGSLNAGENWLTATSAMIVVKSFNSICRSHSNGLNIGSSYGLKRSFSSIWRV